MPRRRFMAWEEFQAEVVESEGPTRWSKLKGHRQFSPTYVDWYNLVSTYILQEKPIAQFAQSQGLFTAADQTTTAAAPWELSILKPKLIVE